jgi:putative endonuclease
LAEQGWTILARNFRHTGFELDLVARKGGTLMAVEVKARRLWHAGAVIDLEQLLPPRKRRALERGLLFYVTRTRLSYVTLRLDLAVVTFDGRGPRAIDYHVGV